MNPYETALAAFRIASLEFHGAQEAYRRTLINDATFLAERAAFLAAEAALNAVEA